MVGESSIKSKREERGFSSSSDLVRSLQDCLESSVGNPCSRRLEDWCLTLTGKCTGAASGRTKKNGGCVGNNCIPQTGHGCMSPGGPRGWDLPGSVGRAIKNNCLEV